MTDQVIAMKRVKENESDEDQELARVEQEESNLKGDYGNVVILLFLYLLQGDDQSG